MNFYPTIYALLLSTLSAGSLAATAVPDGKCQWYKKDASGNWIYEDANIIADRNWGTRTIPRSAAVGSELVDQTLMNQGDLRGYQGFECGKDAMVDMIFDSPPISGLTPPGFPAAAGKVYPTNVPGIGMIMLSRDSTFGLKGVYYPYSSDSLQSNYLERVIQSGVTLVKTGDIAPGNYIVTGQVKMSTQGSVFHTSQFHLGVSVENCAIPNKGTTINVPMGDMQLMNLSEAGAKGGIVQSFSIPLTNCTTGDSSNIAKVKFVGSGGSAIVDADAGVLGLDSRSTASGVGLQLLKADGITPFPLGKASEAGKIESDDMQLNFHARYVKTDAKPKPGIANARAGFTVSYN